MPRAAPPRRALPTELSPRELLQRRLTAFYGTASVVAAFFLLSDHARDLFAQSSPHRSHVGVAAQLVSAFVPAALSLLCRRPHVKDRALHALDVGGFLALAVTAAWAGFDDSDPSSPRLGPLLSGIFLISARAGVVPSTARRTALASFGMAIILAAGEIPTPANGHVGVADPVAVFKLLTVAALLAVYTSHGLYGLRRAVEEARRLGPYVLEEQIGQGAMGVVYKARHALLRRATAIKLLRAERIGEAALARFEREVQATARLTHPSTVAVYDYGRTPDGVFYYAMEHLDGGDLDDLVAYAGPLPAGRVVLLLEQVCRALGEAHRAGLVHRDVKPANVIVCERGGQGDVAKVLDFGLVKGTDARGGAGATHVDGGGAGLTGTPLYMAPESITAPDVVDPRSDLYAVGAVAFFLLTGEPPFRGTTVVEVCAHHIHTPPDRPSARLGAPVPAVLEEVVLRCLSKTAAERFDDAGALADALRDCADVAPWTAGDVRSWWSAHGAGLRACRDARRMAEADGSGSPLPAGTRVPLDLQRRVEPTAPRPSREA